MERAYFDARHRRLVARADRRDADPVDVVDDTLAPPGMHVASLFCQHVHPDLARCARAARWDDARDEVADLMIDTVDRVAPNFRRSVLGRRALSPLDLEREFGLDRRRHLPRRARRSTSCSRAARARPRATTACRSAGSTCAARARIPAAASPALPGRNAAREILKDVRRGDDRCGVPSAAERERPTLRGDPLHARIKPKSADKPGSVTALRAMAVIPLGAALPMRSSHLPADYGEQRRCPPTWCCSGWRLPRFTRLPRCDPDGATRLCGPVPRLHPPR